ncbi:MAG: TetR/AcrR family transcriptional regulator C-terminal ligand-binding domain-containing protein [Phormidesmis sp.]
MGFKNVVVPLLVLRNKLLYWEKYLLPRRQAFAIAIARAKARNEVAQDVDPGLVFDTMSGIMLFYTRMFPPTAEPWADYVRRALHLLLQNPSP